MKSFHPLFVPALVAALAIVGCGEQSNRSEYPDRSQETKAQANTIKQESEQRDLAIKRDLEQQTTALGFEEKQVVDKAKQERERVALDRDQATEPLKLRQQEAKAAAEREAERINAEAKAKLESLNGDEATRVKAEAESKVAEARRKSAEAVSEDEAKVVRARQSADEKIAKIDEQEARQKAAIAGKRTEAERKAREAHLKVSNDTTAKMDSLGKDSAVRVKQQQTQAKEVVETDARIAAAVRNNIERRGDAGRGVTVAANNGVVVLSGVVPNEIVRREIITATGKIDGVARVDDRLAIR